MSGLISIILALLILFFVSALIYSLCKKISFKEAVKEMIEYFLAIFTP